MWGSALRYIPVIALSLATLTGAGCASVPQREFRSYTEAFAEVKNTTEQLLLEYDAAKRAEDESKGGKKPAPAPGPYPGAVTLSLTVDNGPSTDHAGARRQALEVISAFNSVLVSLAEGRKPEEVKSSVESLSSGLSNVAKLVGTNLPIPYAGQVAALLSTVITALDEARNREQFVAALREAEPIIHGILRLFAQDAQDIYQIRARQADRLWTNHQDAVATLVRQMRAVAQEYTAPTGDQAKELAAIERDVRGLLDRAGLNQNSEKLQPATSTKPFDELTLSQLQQTLVQAQAEAAQYEAVIKAQNALFQLVLSYGRLLAQADATLTAVRVAVDRPADIRQQVNELIGVVFNVKRDWEALNAARRAAAG